MTDQQRLFGLRCRHLLVSLHQGAVVVCRPSIFGVSLEIADDGGVLSLLGDPEVLADLVEQASLSLAPHLPGRAR
jgi:hypothetical protein